MLKSIFNSRVIIFFFALIFYSFHAEGQNYFSTKGTDFWLGFMQNYFGDTAWTDTAYAGSAGSKMAVYITTDNQTANGTISVPLTGWSRNFTVSPNTTTEIDMPMSGKSMVICEQSDSIEEKGIHVTSDVPVSVYQLNYVPFTSDAAIIIPTLSLGTSYRAMSYSASDGSFETSELLVVAAYDGTVIKITPTCETIGPGGTQGHAAGSTFTITLNQGEVYQVQAFWSNADDDLTGTLIQLDTTASDNCKKFAVFSGNVCSRVPDGGVCCCNLLCEEMLPIKTWGTDYITVPLKTRKRDRFRITASQNNTTVNLDGAYLTALSAGGFFEYTSGTATYLTATKPVSVAQYSESESTDGNINADPFMIIVQPIDQSLGKIVFNAFATTVIDYYCLNVVTRTAYTSLLTLDGATVPPAAFTLVPFKPAYSYARLDLTQGNHSLASDSGYTANIYGYGDCSSYGYIAGATFINPAIGYNVITPTATIKYYNFTDTICRGTPLTFTAFPNPLISGYSWKFGDGFPVANGTTVSHTYKNAGNYTLTFYYQKTGVCGLDSIVWYINTKCCNPSPGINATTPVCIKSNSSIADTTSNNPNATYTWKFKSGTVVPGSSGEGPYEVNWSAPGKDTVWVIVSEPTCPTDSAYFVITVDPIPTSTFTVNSPLCVKEIANINYTGNADASATFNWNFNGGNVLSGTGIGPYIVNWSMPGTINVTLNVSEGGCTSLPTTVAVTVNALPNPAFTANPQTTTTYSPLITFTDHSTNNISWWSWNFGEPSSGTDNFSSLQSPTHSYSGEGKYTVWLVVKSADSCIDSVSTVINVEDLTTFYVPNAFSPYFGENQVFQPYGLNIITYELYIFTRWGELIFKSENQPWDGNCNGKEVEADVYVWYIKYYNKKGEEKKAWGHVTLLR